MDFCREFAGGGIGKLAAVAVLIMVAVVAVEGVGLCPASESFLVATGGPVEDLKAASIR